jgi:hypothetical protein
MMRFAWLPLLLLAAMTASAEQTEGTELVAVISITLDGPAKFDTVRLPSPPDDRILLHVCIREFDAPAVRCYLLDTVNRAWITVDYTISE